MIDVFILNEISYLFEKMFPVKLKKILNYKKY